VTAARHRVGDAAVVIGGVAPLVSFPALPWPLRTIPRRRSAALQAAAERLTGRLPRLVVERFSTPLGPDLFASDGFHPNLQAHTLWGEEIAALALPLIAGADHSPSRRSTVRMSTSEVSVRSHRTLVGDLQQSPALILVELAAQGDGALDPVDHPFLGLAIRAIGGMDLGLAEPHRQPGRAAAPCAPRRGEASWRCRRREREQQIVRTRTAVEAAGLGRLVGPGTDAGRP